MGELLLAVEEFKEKLPAEFFINTNTLNMFAFTLSICLEHCTWPSTANSDPTGRNELCGPLKGNIL
jgi:hypothetical protein